YAKGTGDHNNAFEMTTLQSCVYGNTDVTGGGSAPATVDPPNLLNLDSCGGDNPTRQAAGRGIYEPGDPIVSIMTALNAAGITEPKDYQGPGPHPDATI